MNPAILAENILANGTLTVTSEVSGYPDDNLLTRIPWKTWKASSSADQTIALELSSGDIANGIGIYNHNLGTVGATVSVQYQGVDTDWYTLDSFSPSDDEIIFRAFDHAGDRTDYRILLAGMSAAAEIGVLILGEYIEFPNPPDVPFTPSIKSIENSGELNTNGHLLGVDTSIYPVMCEASFKNLTRAWVNSTYKPLYDNYLKLLTPVFYGADLDNLTDEIFYVRYNHEQGMNTPLSMLVYVDEIVLTLRGVI